MIKSFLEEHLVDEKSELSKVNRLTAKISNRLLHKHLDNMEYANERILKRVSDAHEIYNECYCCIREVIDEKLKLCAEAERLKNTLNIRFFNANSNEAENIDSEYDNTNFDTLTSTTESEVDEDPNNAELFGLKQDF